MKFSEELKEGLFKRRYKRFFADIEYQGQLITAHLPNTGSLKGCLNVNAPCRFSLSSNPSRRLPYTLHMIQVDGYWVGINTSMANVVAWEAFQKGLVPKWRKYDSGQKEVKIHARSRLDMAFWKSNSKIPASTQFHASYLLQHRFHFVEVKNVTMASGGVSYFPDSVTLRGQKHLSDLMELQKQGHSTEIVFVVQRQDCRVLAPADSIDPEYGRLLRQAAKLGVKITAFPCQMSAHEINLEPRPMGLDI